MIESHDLFHEFPEYQDKIRTLLLSSDFFVRMMKDYDDCDHRIQRIEQNIAPASDFYTEELKKVRVRLKDRLYQMLTQG